MNRREYNGWTNYETWLVNMWYGDIFNDMAENGETVDAEYIQFFVEEMLESDGALPQYGFAADIMNAALREVDWDDLADHYRVEEETEAA
jgi:hypothetical protein